MQQAANFFNCVAGKSYSNRGGRIGRRRIRVEHEGETDMVSTT
jgi:hypothetical protein